MFKRTKKFVNQRVKNVQRGMGLGIINNTWKMTQGIVGSVFAIPDDKGFKETFEEAQERYGLTEKDIHEKHAAFIKQAYLFVFFAMIVLGYAIFLVFETYIISGLVTFAMAVMLALLGLRSHFWAFQISQRKLGCSWQEWLQGKTAPKTSSVTKFKGDV